MLLIKFRCLDRNLKSNHRPACACEERCGCSIQFWGCFFRDVCDRASGASASGAIAAKRGTNDRPLQKESGPEMHYAETSSEAPDAVCPRDGVAGNRLTLHSTLLITGSLGSLLLVIDWQSCKTET